MYTKEFKKKVIAEVDLVKFLKAACGITMHKSGENTWQSRCPHPDHNDSTPSFTVTYKPKEQDWTWYCYGCHNGNQKDGVGNGKKYWGSDIFALICWLSDYKGSTHVKTFPEAVREACEYAGIPLEQDKYAQKYASLRKQAIRRHFNLSQENVKYLLDRGLGMKEIEEWLIGEKECIEYADSKRCDVRRITFPLIEKYGRVVGESSRKMPTDHREHISKYWNSPRSDWFNKRMYLYGAHRLDDTCNEIYIVEGVMDVILGDKYGRNFVAPLGTSFTEEHAMMIKRSGRVPVFCQDGDAAGQKAIARSVAIMARIGVYAKVLIMPYGLDMADLANREQGNLMNYIRTHSMLYSQYLMKDVIAECDSRIQEILYEMLPRLKDAAAGIQSENERMVINGYVKERFGVDIAV